MNNVLVYGTLRTGAPTFALSGFRMYDLGSFPGVEYTGNLEDKIQVEKLVNVTDERLRSAYDCLEGYRENSPESSLYVRKEVWSGALSAPTWIYVYNGFFEGHSNVLIEEGDWLKHVDGIVGSNSSLVAEEEIQQEVEGV